MGCATSQPEVKDHKVTQQQQQQQQTPPPPAQPAPAVQPAATTVPAAPAAAAVSSPTRTQADEPNPVYSAPDAAVPQPEGPPGAGLPGSNADPTVPQQEPAINGAVSEDDDEGTVSIDALLAEPAAAPPTKRATRRSTDSVMVENIDVFNYTSLASKSQTLPRQAPNLRFEVDGIRTAYDVGKTTSMDTLLKASRRAATYHGAGAGGQGPASVEELVNERRRSYLEKIQMPLLVEEPTKEGEATYQFDATHAALKGLDWKTYFQQEGDNPPAPKVAAPKLMPVVDGEDDSGVLSIEQLLSDPNAASGDGHRSSGNRRASAVM